MVPTERFTLFTRMLSLCFLPVFRAFSKRGRRMASSTVFSSSKSNTSSGLKWTALPSGAEQRILERSTFFALGILQFSRTFRHSVCPTISESVRKPSFAMISRSSWAMKSMKFMTYSGLPLKRLRKASFWVATPTGQVSRLQTRIIMQPMVTRGAVAKPNSSAPRRAAMATSRPLMSLPSVSMTTRLLKWFCISVWCVSARPSSQGSPA